MSDTTSLSSAKGHRDENFPVASRLVRRELRPAILAFYRFARAADDVADNPSAGATRKFAALDLLEAGLRGDPTGAREGLALHASLRERGLSDRHPLDLLTAFRQDVTIHRYEAWEGLMDYCRYSAAPVGRFVLDLHGEPSSLWPANDALCSALQVINHLQDCAKDFRQLDRVYLPRDELALHGVSVDSLKEAVASEGLRAVIATLAGRTRELLCEARPMASLIMDRRLAFEVAVIQSLADDLVARLFRRDPLSERVHHSKIEAAAFALRGLVRVLLDRRRR